MNVKTIKQKIKSGEIKNWPDVYGYTTAKEMSEALGRSEKHWKYVQNRPGKLTIQDMDEFIKAVGVTKAEFLKVVEGED